MTPRAALLAERTTARAAFRQCGRVYHDLSCWLDLERGRGRSIRDEVKENVYVVERGGRRGGT